MNELPRQEQPALKMRLLRRVLHGCCARRRRAGRSVTGFGPLCRVLIGRTSPRGRRYLVNDYDDDLKLLLALDDEVESRIFWTGCDADSLLPTLAEQLAPDDVLLDVGANIGECALFAAKRLPAGHVFAFEPAPGPLARLHANLALNDLHNVTVLGEAVTDRDGQAPLYLRLRHQDHGTLSRAEATLCGGAVNDLQVIVPSLRIDTFVDTWGLTRVDWIKIDVEGAEAAVLRGAHHCLETFRPKLILDVRGGDPRAGEAGHDDLRALLQAHGYELRELPNFGHHGDVLALPRERVAATALTAREAGFQSPRVMAS